MTGLPLDGVTVVGLEQAVAAPFATRQLADLGARVIKIERPDGGDFARGYDTVVEGQSSAFVWLNRGKESVQLDLADPDGFETLHRLLARADVLVANLSPATLERRGLTAAALAPRHPHLITCTVSGYPPGGPSEKKKAYDALVQAEAGLMSLTGSAGAPAKVGISIADIAAGMYVYSGIPTALLQRANTGEGTTVEVSLFEALAEWMGQPAYYTRHGGSQPPRLGTQHATIAPYGTYTAADGGEVLFSIQNEREWAALCAEFLGRPELAEDPRFATASDRVAHRGELDAVVAERFARSESDEILKDLERIGIACAGVNDVAAFLDHPVLAARGRWTEVAVPGATVEALLPPADLAGLSARMDPVPAVGEHTAAILGELGRTDEEVEALRADGVV